MVWDSIRMFIRGIGRRFAVLREMFQNLISRPVTILYPEEKVPIPEGFRGAIAITDKNCIGCSRCAQVCPVRAITMIEGPREIEVKGKKINRKKMPQVDIYNCIRCGLCERHCPMKGEAIHLTREISKGGTDKDVIVIPGDT